MAKEAKAESTKLALPLVIQNELGKDVINIRALDPTRRNQLAKITTGLQKAMQDFATSGLQIGLYLFQAKEMLLPQRAFVPYLNTIPGLSQSAAYRWIAAYENGQKLLPKPILNLALSTGLDLVSTSKDRPFGKYQEAVAKVGIPKSPSEAEARSFMANMLFEYKQLRSGARITTPTTHQQRAFGSIVGAWARLPKDNQKVSWLTELFGYVLSHLQFESNLSIKPVRVPKGFVLPKKTKGKAGRPTSVEKAGEQPPQAEQTS